MLAVYKGLLVCFKITQTDQKPVALGIEKSLRKQAPTVKSTFVIILGAI
jgi:hypothetical protein